MIDKNIKKITGDLGNFINVDGIAWCDENGYIVNLESVDLNNKEFNWTAEPGAYYVCISEIFDCSDPTRELELCLIEQLKESASKLWFVKHSGRPWEYQIHTVVDKAIFGSNHQKSYYSDCSEKRLILIEITKEMFETLREQLKKTRKFKLEIET